MPLRPGLEKYPSDRPGGPQTALSCRWQISEGPELLLRPGLIAQQRMLIRGSGPSFFVSYVLRADYVLRTRGLEPRLRGGESGMSEIQMGLILLGIIVVLELILVVWIAGLGG
jgi:hypothetical protein